MPTRREPRTTDSTDNTLTQWLRTFLAHARANHGVDSALMVNEPGTPDLHCQQLILNAPAGLLTRAQQHSTARSGLTADDLLRFITGIALSTARDQDTEPAHRLLALVLDAVYAVPRQGR
ncbi:hypothetical protein [Streptomyces griseorubiginosus]|uniref:SbtR family transcriptional regulator n=1 Tax=Streptomyces griseorubiginosus TaxID=67304 RepID=UPI000AC99792